MNEKSKMIRRARALEALRNLADIRARRVWGQVFEKTGSVHDANYEANLEYADTMRHVRAISESYVVKV